MQRSNNLKRTSFHNLISDFISLLVLSPVILILSETISETNPRIQPEKCHLKRRVLQEGGDSVGTVPPLHLCPVPLTMADPGLLRGEALRYWLRPPAPLRVEPAAAETRRTAKAIEEPLERQPLKRRPTLNRAMEEVAVEPGRKTAAICRALLRTRLKMAKSTSVEVRSHTYTHA